MARRFRPRRAGTGRSVLPAAATRRLVAVGVLLVALLAPLLLPIGSAAATRVPAGYNERIVAELPGGQPIGLAFLPDGGLLVTSKEGRLFLVANATSPAPEPPRVVLDLSARTCGNGERGLLGVAVDPVFATNSYVYLYYTFKRAPGCPMGAAGYPLNRVSRFTLDGSPRPEATEVVLVANIASYQGNHNGGDLNFGNDGNLYVSVGDGGCQIGSPTRCQPDNRNARFGHILHGKILRITSDGSPAEDNPFSGPGTVPCAARGFAQPGQRCQEIFAFGLRNPFRFAFDPNTPPTTTRFYINDVGGRAWEEIDPAGDGYEGADYGWNVREGPCRTGLVGNCGRTPASMTNPIASYGHGRCSSITGGAFVPDGAWSSPENGDYLYADFVCGGIFRLRFAAGKRTQTWFASGVGGPTALRFGPDNALYYADLFSGQVRRIDRTG